MRVVWLVFVGLIVAMALVLPRLYRRVAPAPAADSTDFQMLPVAIKGVRGATHPSARADSIVAFGLAQRGTPYVFAGTSPLTGFDCSGFILYIFAHFGVAVPHSTALLIDVGRPVDRTDAQPGDIVVFTGTAATSTTPGHAGIVISGRGEVPLRFVHASSSRREPFVKVSQIEGSDYERRFMQVRRVLGPGEVATARPKLAAPARPAAPIAALPTRPVAVAAAKTPLPALPQKLTPKKATTRSAIARKKVAKAGSARRKPASVARPTQPAKHSVARKRTTR